MIVSISQGNAAPVALTLLQATNVAGAGAKPITNPAPIWANLDTDASDTMVRQADGVSFTTDAAVKNKQIIFHVDPAYFDIAGGYDCLQVTTGASNAATSPPWTSSSRGTATAPSRCPPPSSTDAVLAGGDSRRLPPFTHIHARAVLMWVKQLIGRLAGSVVDLPYSAAENAIANGTAVAATDQEVVAAGFDVAPVAPPVALDVMPIGYRVEPTEVGGFDLFDAGGVRLNEEPLPNMAAVLSEAHDRVAATVRPANDAAGRPGAPGHHRRRLLLADYRFEPVEGGGFILFDPAGVRLGDDVLPDEEAAELALRQHYAAARGMTLEEMEAQEAEPPGAQDPGAAGWRDLHHSQRRALAARSPVPSRQYGRCRRGDRGIRDAALNRVPGQSIGRLVMSPLARSVALLSLLGAPAVQAQAPNANGFQTPVDGPSQTVMTAPFVRTMRPVHPAATTTPQQYMGHPGPSARRPTGATTLRQRGRAGHVRSAAGADRHAAGHGQWQDAPGRAAGTSKTETVDEFSGTRLGRGPETLGSASNPNGGQDRIISIMLVPIPGYPAT